MGEGRKEEGGGEMARGPAGGLAQSKCDIMVTRPELGLQRSLLVAESQKGCCRARKSTKEGSQENPRGGSTYDSGAFQSRKKVANRECDGFKR